MIITRTPLRISLVGGGTDVPAFYRKHGGAVVSMTIDKYVYVSVNDKFDRRTRVSYSTTENVDDPSELKHDIVREVLKYTQTMGVEVTTVSDIPGEGSGLGSSSALTVGLLNALHYKNCDKPYPKKMLAEVAYMIERTQCGHPGVGKQDQYAASYGGLHYFQFEKDESVSVEPIFLFTEQKEYLESHLLLLYTGQTRKADVILADQENNLKSDREGFAAAVNLKGLAFDLANEFQKGQFEHLGTYLFKAWKFKKRLSASISTPELDRIYQNAIGAGAVGGKLLGAGGGGFFLFFADPKLHIDIMAATSLRRVEFKIEPEGSKVIYAKT